MTKTYASPMPSDAERLAPASAPATRAESIVVRDMPSAPIRCSRGMVSPISALRITWSFGRTMPASAATTSTQAGVNRPAKREDHQERRQDRERRAQAAEHRATAQAVAEHAEHRRDERPQELQRAEQREEQHGPRVDHHVPAEDERLHLERPRREEIGGELKAEASDAQRSECERPVGGHRWPRAEGGT